MGLKERVSLRDLDKIVAIAGVVFSILLIAYLGRQTGRVLYLLTGVLTLISCLLWLAIRKGPYLDFHPPESWSLTRLCSVGFFGLYALSVLSVYLRPNLYERPLPYFVLTALMAGLIACEIFTSNRRYTGLLLAQIALLGISIAWSQLLIFPGLVGVDPWYHSYLTDRIVTTGSIPGSTVYSKLPLFHVMIAVASLVNGLPYKEAAMASASLPQILCNAVFVFLITNRLFRDHRAGLLAALLVIIANHQLWLSFWSIPNGFAAIFIPVALYLLLFRYRESSTTANAFFLLLILLFASIILTHTLTATCMAILLFIAWGALALFRIRDPAAEERISIFLPIGFVVAMFGWWSYGSRSLGTLGGFIGGDFGMEHLIGMTPPAYLKFAAAVPLGEQLINQSGMLLFFGFSFIGVFYMISRRRNGLTFSMALLGAAPLAIGFSALITGRTVINERWFFFAQILMSVPLAIAVYSLGTWRRKRSLSFYCIIFGFVAGLCFLMIMSGQANIDNRTFSASAKWRASVTEGELRAISTLADTWDGPLLTDEYFAGIQKYRYPQVSSYSENINRDDFQTDLGCVILIRDDTVLRPFKVYAATVRLNYDLNDKLDELGFSRIYDSSAGSGYRI